MDRPAVVWLALVATAGISVGLAGLLSTSGPVDEPRARGLHARSTPTSGGLAMVAAVAAGLLVVSSFGGVAIPLPLVASFTLAAAMGLLGAIDDVFDVGAKAKLVVQILLALAFVALGARVEAIPLGPAAAISLGPIVGGLGSALWIVVVVNAVNFMDGANGLASGALVIAFAGLALVCGLAGSPVLALAALFGAIANLGFLPWNFPKARLFQGDVGAFFSAALFAALSLAAAGRAGSGPVPLMIGPLLLAPLLVDVFMTLIRRARQRSPLLDAHREHLYQRKILAASGRATGVVGWFWLTMAVFSTAAVLAVRVGLAVQSLLLFIPILLQAAVWTAQNLRLKNRP